MDRRWDAGHRIDLTRTLSPLQRGPGDPTHRFVGGVFWRCAWTPDGSATLAINPTSETAVHATAWGSGAGWILDGVPDLLGAADDPTDFAPRHPLLHRLAQHCKGLRITRTRTVFDQLVPTIIEQQVSGIEAHRAWRRLVQRFGARPPGPTPDRMRMPLTPDQICAITDWEWHRCGLDGKRRRTVIAAARVARRLEETISKPSDEAMRLLQTVPGIGPWTAAEVAQRSFGDADAVSVGDYNIPGMVGYALTGEAVDDDGMLALLAPYRPHRHRVVRLLEESGMQPPRRAPRARLRDYRAI